MITKNFESTSNIQNPSEREALRHALIEIQTGEASRRIVVPYSRWKDIEKWFYDTDSTEV